MSRLLGPLQTLRVGRALFALIRDPTKTEKIFEIADVGLKAKDQAPVKAVIDEAMADPGFRSLYERRFLPPHPNPKEMLSLPEGTLGRGYADHMVTNGLDPDFYPDVEVTDASWYFEKRARQTHDIWHVVLGYDTDVYGELALQGFTWANTGAGLSGLIIAAGIMHVLQNHGTESRRYMDGVIEGYQRGKKARYFVGIPWEEMWERPLADVRQDVGV